MGASGLESASVPVRFKLNTDIVAHPWRLTTATASGGNWLHVSATNGTVSGSDATVDVDASGVQLDAGVYSGSIEIQATVNGDVVKQTIPVTLNFETNRRAGAPRRFDVLDSATLVKQRFIDIPASSLPVAFPTNVEICWNELLAGGAYAPGYGHSPKIYVFDVAGNLLAQLGSGSGILFPRTVHFSGNGSRILAGSEGGLRIQDAPTPP